MIIELLVIGSLRDWQNPIFPFNILEFFFCNPTHSSRVAEANKKSKEKVQSIAFLTAIFAIFIVFFLFFEEIEKVSFFLISWNWTTKSKQLTLFQSPQLLISSGKKKQDSNDSIELFSSELLLRGKIQKVLALKW